MIKRFFLFIAFLHKDEIYYRDSNGTQSFNFAHLRFLLTYSPTYLTELERPKYYLNREANTTFLQRHHAYMKQDQCCFE